MWLNRLKGTKTKYNLLLEVIVMLIRWELQWERHIYCIKLFPLSWGLKALWMQYGHDHRSWASLHWPLLTLSKSFFTWSIFQSVQKLSIICQLGICHHLPLTWATQLIAPVGLHPLKMVSLVPGDSLLHFWHSKNSFYQGNETFFFWDKYYHPML